MEHKHNQAIQEKLDSLSYPPMAWRKEQVWLKIEQNTSKRPDFSWIYRAAAIIMVIATVLVSYQKWDRQQSEKIISQLEKKLLLQEPLIRLSTNPITPIICLSEEPSEMIITSQTKSRISVEHPASQAIVKSEVIDVSESLPSVALMPNDIYEPQSQTEVSRVPIILGAEPPVIYTVSKRDKRMRMKLFKQEQVEPNEVMAQSHEQLFISRPKKH